MKRALGLIAATLLVAGCNQPDDKLPDDLSLSEGNAAALNAAEVEPDNGVSPIDENAAAEVDANAAIEVIDAVMANDIDAAAPVDTGDPLAPRAEAGPSFDCGQAATIVERRICAVPALARLDREVSAAYMAAVDGSTPERRAQLQAVAQRRLAERDRCRFDACVRETYVAYGRDIAAIAAKR